MYAQPIRRHHAALGLLSLMALLAIGGCAQGGGREQDFMDKFSCKVSPSSCVNLIVPPKLVEAGGLKTVAIVPGSGNGANSVATELESRLSAVQVDDKPYYQIVPASDPSRQGVFEVNVTTWAVSDDRETQTRFDCVDDKCKKTRERKLNCTVRKGTVGSLIRLRDRSGKLLATRNSSGVATSTQCAGEQGTLLTPPEMLGQAVGELMKTVQDELAVRTLTKRVNLLNDVTGIDGANVARFKSALDFAKGGRLLDRACPIFEELSESEPRSVAVYYNAGFCAQAKGDWRQAYTLYAKADAGTTQPVEQLKAVLTETRPYSVQKK